MTRTLILYLCVAGSVSDAEVEDRIDWPAFLARHDMVWESVPKVWHEGAFLGNGLLGAMIYSEGENSLQWDVGRSDVTDRGNRLAIGRFALVPEGPVSGGDLRLDLWNAEARGKLQTTAGAVEWRSLTHSERMATLIELRGGPAQMVFQHLPATPARAEFKKEVIPPEKRNPEPTTGTSGEISWCRQPFTAGGGYTVAWGEQRTAAGRLFAFTVDATPKPDQAVATIRAALAEGLDSLQRSHRQWWHGYWPRGFLSLPDTRMESFYWIQMYKLASGTRADRPALDLMGPWFRRTPWPMIWWNLNIQLTYWPVYTANRLDLGESLTRMLDAGMPHLIANVPEAWRGDSAGIGRTSSYDCRGAGSEIGNLTWAMHNYWLQYRYSGDEALLRDRLYPLLRRAATYMVHRLETGPDGRLHFPVDVSPEYPDRAPDTNYNVALLRWALQTLLAANEPLGHLAPFPVDPDTGYMIGAGVPLKQSHRHFSHLLLVYPLHLVDARSPSDRPLIEKSLDHWIGFEGALQGYSFTGASAMSSWLGRKEAAVSLLSEFLDRYVKANTMYLEAGPVIETPLAGAAALQEVLLQSWSMEPWGTDIRVFPAVPASWPDVTIHRLLAEGALEVSAARRGGQTRFVQIKILAGAPCRVWTGLAEPVVASGARPFTAKTEAGLTVVDLRQGETVLLTSGPPPAGLEISPVAAQPGRTNYYGSRKVAPVTPDAQGRFTCTARQAGLQGKALFLQGKGDEMNIGHWTEAADCVIWKIEVRQPGKFRVVASYAATGGGSRFAVEAAGSVAEAARQSTGGWDKFRDFELGTLTLPAGTVELRVRSADGKPPLLNLRQISLINQGP
jgi:alpha-L-fucosidase 2